MEKDLKDNLKKFLDVNVENDEDKNIILINNNKDGLVERVDKTFVLNDGRQLLAD